jgi:hypothetical protein
VEHRGRRDKETQKEESKAELDEQGRFTKVDDQSIEWRKQQSTMKHDSRDGATEEMWKKER